ncbi:MAG: peptidoglycan editing factor PgeF [Gammaproteobacteria bacterium]|nr:peptidoglycan editing factor PgeF [Gammaproteobacteria bacterium]
MTLILKPDWSLPNGVNVAFTYGYEAGQGSGYGDFNLAMHVGDAEANVLKNRERLEQELSLPAAPLWLNQVHGVEVADAHSDNDGVTADASVGRGQGAVLAVMTADCLPVLFYSQEFGGVVGAAHAGWRGLCNGVLEATVAKMAVSPSSISCWLGPAIGPACFEVGSEVKAAFENLNSEAGYAFAQSGDKFLADIYLLARQRLHALGIDNVIGGEWCTVTDERFYSYRRSGSDKRGQAKPCGRMASLIWLS